MKLVGLPVTVRLGPGQTRALPAHLQWAIPRASGLIAGRTILTGHLSVTGQVSSSWVPVIKANLLPAFTLGGLTGARANYGGSYVRTIDVMQWAMIGGAVLGALLLCFLTYLFAVPRLRGDLVLLNLADDHEVPLTVHGHRRWRGDLDDVMGSPGSILVRGARRGGARISLRREMAVATRSGRGRLTRDGILVLASLAFRHRTGELP
ncbi:MAG TPA: hypothetical protein DHU96_11170 [Actinobacteria bacterium]|nr:hypothetical protein [Actinomycetota bacterium]